MNTQSLIQKNKKIICSDCHNSRLVGLKPGTNTYYKTCNKCRKRGKETREIQIKRSKCALEECPNQSQINKKYCGKHEKYNIKEQLESEGHRVCSNFDRRKCVNVVTDPTKKRCDVCCNKGNAGDQKRRDLLKETREKIVEQHDNGIMNELIQCRSCSFKGKMEDFIGKNGKKVTTCVGCRHRQALIDEKRKERDRSHEYKTPEYRARKKRWRDRNPEKCIGYWRDYRLREINKDLKAYLQRNAEYSKNYRMKNKERMREYMMLYNNNISAIICKYKQSARDRQKTWNLTIEQATNMILGSCFYCGAMADNTPNGIRNGIDCVDSALNYVDANCVSCCKTCNYMKTKLDAYVFIKRCEHILTFQGHVDGEMNYDLFWNYDWSQDRPGYRYNIYKKSAQNKNIPFNLTPAEFEEIISKPCYMCGKQNSAIHQNGCDRVKNEHSIGYNVDNCKACCGECNYMKKDLDLEFFYTHLRRIYDNYKEDDNMNLKSKSLYDATGNVALNTRSITANPAPRLKKADKQKIRQDKRDSFVAKKNDPEIERQERQKILANRLPCKSSII